MDALRVGVSLVVVDVLAIVWVLLETQRGIKGKSVWLRRVLQYIGVDVAEV